MKKVPKGAIVSHNELTIIAGGLDVAIETLSGYIDSETVHGRKPTAKERQSMTALKESRRLYQNMLKRVCAAKERCS